MQLTPLARADQALLLGAQLTTAPRTNLLQVPVWEAIPHLVHGFYARHGGVSRGPFAELNLSFRVGDHPDAVRENWHRVDPQPSGLRFVTMKQLHGTHLASVVRADADAEEADGLLTSMAGAALSVLTADCVPILLVVPRQHAIAAVHAGWRGTVAGIARRAVQHLQRTSAADPADIQAALGPAIGGCCYEVGPEVVEALQEHWGSIPGAIHPPGPGKARLDLRRANEEILLRAGLRATHIAQVGPCTKCSVADYFSYRAAPVTGRQLSFIAWKE